MNTITLFKSGSTWHVHVINFFGIFFSNTLSASTINNWKGKWKENANGDTKAFVRQIVSCTVQISVV